MSNFYAELALSFEGSAQRPALLLNGQPDWSYADLLDRVRLAAAELDAFGAVAGDRVMVQLPKSPENLALYLACLQLGLVYVPLNTA